MHTILIIDDHKEFRRMTNRMFTQEGYQVIEAENGQEGINVCKSTPIDIVVTDLFMPEKDGFETITELKSIAPEIKLIGVSGGGASQQLGFLEAMQKFGADKVFAKPFDNSVLLEAADQLLSSEEPII